jgi:hypothetical protein
MARELTGLVFLRGGSLELRGFGILRGSGSQTKKKKGKKALPAKLRRSGPGAGISG